MPITPEDRARETIDRLLTGAGWLIQSRDETNINAARGVAHPGIPPKTPLRRSRLCPPRSGKNQWRMKSESSRLHARRIGSWKEFRNSITLWPRRVNSGGYDTNRFGDLRRRRRTGYRSRGGWL